MSSQSYESSGALKTAIQQSVDPVFQFSGTTVSVTGATTAIIGKMHLCSGASAYTITLPAVSGNAGHRIGFIFNPTSDAIITLDGDGSETINNETTLAYIANESAILYCDGTRWFAQQQLRDVSFQAYASTTTSIASGAWGKLTLDSESWDPCGWFDSSASNYKFTPKAPGVYQVMGSVQIVACADTKRFLLDIYRNGSAYLAGNASWQGALSNPILSVAEIMSLNGSTDYIELYVNNADTASRDTSTGLVTTRFSAYRISNKAR